MTQTLCQLKKKAGGDLKETVLWTNLSPTSSFAAQTITLSEDINNFKFIQVNYRLSTTNASEGKTIWPIEMFIQSVGDNKTRCGIVSVIGSQGYVRNCNYSSSTAMVFSDALKTLVAGTDGTHNIPLKIIGLS